MLRLNISQQYAKLDITTERPFLGMKATPPKLDIQTEPVTVEIRQPRGELEIDNRPLRASYGIKDPGEFMRDCAESGKQAALEAVGRIAQEGDRLAAIETHENAIANISAEASFSPAPGITWAHLEKPNIHYTVHPVEFTPREGHVTINVEPGTLDMDYRPGTVNIRMAQYQSIKMWTTGSAVDMSA